LWSNLLDESNQTLSIKEWIKCSKTVRNLNEEISEKEFSQNRNRENVFENTYSEDKSNLRAHRNMEKPDSIDSDNIYEKEEEIKSIKYVKTLENVSEIDTNNKKAKRAPTHEIKESNFSSIIKEDIEENYRQNIAENNKSYKETKSNINLIKENIVPINIFPSHPLTSSNKIKTSPRYQQILPDEFHNTFSSVNLLEKDANERSSEMPLNLSSLANQLSELVS